MGRRVAVLALGLAVSLACAQAAARTGLWAPLVAFLAVGGAVSLLRVTWSLSRGQVFLAEPAEDVLLAGALGAWATVCRLAAEAIFGRAPAPLTLVVAWLVIQFLLRDEREGWGEVG